MRQLKMMGWKGTKGLDGKRGLDKKSHQPSGEVSFVMNCDDKPLN